MRNLKINYKKIKSFEFTAQNGIGVEVNLNGDNTVSVSHKSAGCMGIQADFSTADLGEYIGFLQTLYKQTKES